MTIITGSYLKIYQSYLKKMDLPNSERIVVRLPEELKKLIETYCAEQNMEISDFVRSVLCASFLMQGKEFDPDSLYAMINGSENFDLLMADMDSIIDRLLYVEKVANLSRNVIERQRKEIQKHVSRANAEINRNIKKLKKAK